MVAKNVVVWYNNSMENKSLFSISKDVTHGRGYVYALQYHIVWVTMNRQPIFTGAIETDVSHYLRTTLESLDMIQLSMEVMPDHVHLLVDC